MKKFFDLQRFDNGLNFIGKTIWVSSSFKGDSIYLENYPNYRSVNASAVKSDIEIYGNSSDNLLVGGKGDDILWGKSGNDTLTGGNGNDVFICDSGKTVITDYTTGQDKIQLTSVTSSRLNDSDVIFTTSTGSITVKSAKSTKIAIMDENGQEKVTVVGGSSNGGDDDGGDDNGGGDDEKNKWSLNGTTAKYGTSSKTLATVKGAKSKSGITLSGKKITLKNSALNKKVTVSGSYEFDFASDYKNATISGTKNNDTITARGQKISVNGGKGNDVIKTYGAAVTMTGGAGNDIFAYNSGASGLITDYAAGDKISILSGTAKVTESGNNVIFTSGKGKITVKGGKSKKISYFDTNGSHTYSSKAPDNTYKINSRGTAITLNKKYLAESFNVAAYGDAIQTINASAVVHDLNIIGNNLANKITGSSQDDTIDGGAGADKIYGGNGNDSIFGGKGNDELHGGKGKDTLWGGAGNDELYGDDGRDVFYYKFGEGDDTIFGYEASVDKIILGSGSISNFYADRNNNVIFTIGEGQLVVNNCADRTVKIVNPSGQIVSLYEP